MSEFDFPFVGPRVGEHAAKACHQSQRVGEERVRSPLVNIYSAHAPPKLNNKIKK